VEKNVFNIKKKMLDLQVGLDRCVENTIGLSQDNNYSGVINCLNSLSCDIDKVIVKIKKRNHILKFQMDLEF